MQPPDNSYFDEDSLASAVPEEAKKTTNWLPFSIGANIALLLVCLGAFWLWKTATAKANRLEVEKSTLAQTLNNQASMSATQASACPPPNTPTGGSDRYRNKDLGLVALLYNNLGEEVPIKIATPGDRPGTVKNSKVILASESDYQVDHLERLSFTSKGKASNTAALCIDIPVTALPAAECKKGSEVCDN